MTSTAPAEPAIEVAGGPRTLAPASGQFGNNTIGALIVGVDQRARPGRPGRARDAVEAAAPMGWDGDAGSAGEVVGMRSFHTSAPYAALTSKFGFNPAHICQAAGRRFAVARRRREDPAHV
jgi:hypothetical protein